MVEQPKWLKVVGGKEHTPESEKVPGAASEVTNIDLIRLNKAIRANLPADYKSKMRQDLVEQHIGEMKGWSIAQLHNALSQSDIWERPSHTVAALEEVRLRMLAGSMGPRRG